MLLREPIFDGKLSLMAKRLIKVWFTEHRFLLMVLAGSESFYTVPKKEETTQAYTFKQAIFNIRKRDPDYQDPSVWNVIGIEEWNSTRTCWELKEVRRPGEFWEEER
jgi:hypothetical protein